MLTKCPMCDSKKKIIKLGCIKVDCPKCDGKGWLVIEKPLTDNDLKVGGTDDEDEPKKSKRKKSKK